MLNQCWSTVYDAGPTFVQHWVDASCLLGYHILLAFSPLKYFTFRIHITEGNNHIRSGDIIHYGRF